MYADSASPIGMCGLTMIHDPDVQMNIAAKIAITGCPDLLPHVPRSHSCGPRSTVRLVTAETDHEDPKQATGSRGPAYKRMGR
jgi:hypothetical protein